MKEQDYIAFEDYVSKNLSKEEDAVFEEKLKTNSAFAEAFQIYKEMSSFLGDKFGNEGESNAFKQNLESISNNHFNEDKVVSEVETSSKTFILFKYAIAACVVLMFGIFTFNQFSNPTYSDYANYDAVSLTVRGGNNDLLKTAENAFNNKDFASAEEAFKQLIELDKDSSELKLYRAISNIELNNFEISDVLLKDLSNGNSAFKNKATWYLALSKLKQNDETACIEILKTISEDADDYKQAQKMVKKLD